MNGVPRVPSNHGASVPPTRGRDGAPPDQAAMLAIAALPGDGMRSARLGAPRRSRSELGRRLPNAPEPSRHPELLELAVGGIEKRQRALAVAGRAAPLIHDRLVEVGDGPERPRPLLVQDGAGAGEPVGGFVV